MMMEEEYNILDATVEVFTKIIKAIASLAKRVIKWAYDDF